MRHIVYEPLSENVAAMKTSFVTVSTSVAPLALPSEAALAAEDDGASKLEHS